MSARAGKRADLLSSMSRSRFPILRVRNRRVWEQQSGRSDMGLVYSVVVGAIVLEAVEDVETRGPRDITTTLAIYGCILAVKVAVFVFLRTRPAKSLSDCGCFSEWDV